MYFSTHSFRHSVWALKKYQECTLHVDNALWQADNAKNLVKKNLPVIQRKPTECDWMEQCLQGKIPCLKPFKEDINKSEWDQHGLRGLINMGNTCFMSCILQVLAHNPASQAYFLHNHRHTTHLTKAPVQQYCLTCEVAALFLALFEQGRANTQIQNPVVPHRVLYATWKFADRMAGYEQQDAHEFLMILLDGLIAHSDQDKIPPAPVNEIFRGSFRSDIVHTYDIVSLSQS